MSNLAAVLKEEIRRLARKEARGLTGALKRNSASHRRDLAELKRQVAGLSKAVAFLMARERERIAKPSPSDDAGPKARFSAKWLAKHRGRLKLSAADYGKLVGVSGQTVYHWEQEKARPRQAQLAALVAVRKLRRREALRRLEMLAGQAAPQD